MDRSIRMAERTGVALRAVGVAGFFGFIVACFSSLPSSFMGAAKAYDTQGLVGAPPVPPKRSVVLDRPLAQDVRQLNLDRGAFRVSAVPLPSNVASAMAAAPPDSVIEANSRLASIPAAAPIATLPARLEFVAPLIEDRQAAKVPLPPTRPDPVRSDMTVALAPALSDMRERSALQPETQPGSVAQDDNADLKQGIPPAFVALIERHAREAGVDERWMFAVLRAENAAFDAKIISSAGAIGLMQVMPAVGRAYGANDLTDPEQNVRAAARFLRDLFDKYGNPVVVIGAYNAGEPKVDVRAGLPVITETVDYVSRVTSYYYTGGRDNVHPLRRNRDLADAAGDRGDAVRRLGPVNQAEAALKRDVKSISRAERIRQSSIVMNTVDGSASQQGEVR